MWRPEVLLSVPENMIFNQESNLHILSCHYKCLTPMEIDAATSLGRWNKKWGFYKPS